MKILFFDMEFANGQVPGSIYSVGYLVTNEYFEILTPATDVCMNPECEWNEYVEQNILAYPKEDVETSPAFPEHYEALKALFASVDIAVGFAVGNDVKALRRDCMRYDLPEISYRYFDMEKLCRKTDEHREARGLDGCVRAWCGEEPEHRHRSDGDAYATMLLLQAICKHAHVSADMLFIAYPECAGVSVSKNQPKQQKKATPQGKKHHRRHRAKAEAKKGEAK